MTRKRIFILTGGLGNQLFQFASSLNSREKTDVLYDISLGNPRVSNANIPDLFDFDISKITPFELLSNKSKFFSKLYGYNLRSGFSPRNWEKLSIVKFLVSAISRLLFSIRYKSFVRVKVARNLGYDARLSRGETTEIFIGYFQSYIWDESQEVNERLLDLKLKYYSEEVKTYIDLAKIEEPLIVHVRLGDYLKENSFGIPSLAYYSQGISTLMESFNFRKIWLFSDDPKLAIDRIPINYREQVRLIDPTHFTPSETLELMRFGKGYLLANSSFSWWGAFLSHTKDCPVIAPRKWFKLGPQPDQIIPPSWQTIEAFER